MPRTLLIVQLALAAAGIIIIAVTWKSAASVAGTALVVSSIAVSGVRMIQLRRWAPAAVFFVVCVVLVVLTGTRVA